MRYKLQDLVRFEKSMYLRLNYIENRLIRRREICWKHEKLMLIRLLIQTGMRYLRDENYFEQLSFDYPEVNLKVGITDSPDQTYIEFIPLVMGETSVSREQDYKDLVAWLGRFGLNPVEVWGDSFWIRIQIDMDQGLHNYLNIKQRT